MLGAAILLLDAALMLAFARGAGDRCSPGGGRAAADRARGGALDAGAPVAGLPARAAAVRAAGLVHVGRAGPPRRRRDRPAAWPRWPRCSRWCCRPALDSHKPWVNYEALAGSLHARSRRAVRLVPALRTAELAAQGPRGARRAGPSARTTGRPRTSTRSTAAAGCPGRCQAATSCAGVEPLGDPPLDPDDPRDDPRDEDQQHDRRRDSRASRASSRARPSRGRAPAPGRPRPSSAPATATPSRCTTRIPTADPARVRRRGLQRRADRRVPHDGAAGQHAHVPPARGACSRRSTPTSRCWRRSAGPTTRRRVDRQGVPVRPHVRAGQATRAQGHDAVRVRLERQGHTSSRGFSYNEDTPNSQYPLVRFLFTDKFGYCQQFSGTMALLLRMGGMPARVAAGFTTGA